MVNNLKNNIKALLKKFTITVLFANKNANDNIFELEEKSQLEEICVDDDFAQNEYINNNDENKNISEENEENTEDIDNEEIIKDIDFENIDDSNNFETVVHSESNKDNTSQQEDNIDEHIETEDTGEEYIVCPICKYKCDINSAFCGKCGKNLQTKTCPACGNKTPVDNKFCIHCGYSFNGTVPQKQVKTQDSANGIIKFFISLIMMIFIGAIFVGANLFIEEAKEDLKPKAESCESQVVKDLAVSIFKENNEMYKSIDPKSIASIILRYPTVNGYDESIDKYECSGEIFITSNISGFLPLSMEYDNKLYQKIAHEPYWDEDNWYWDRYTTYRVPVEYTSQLSEGSTLVYLRQYNNQAEFATTNGDSTMPSKKPKRLKYADFEDKTSDDYEY